MRDSTLLFLALLFISCAPTIQSVDYRPKDYGGPPWKIEARWHSLGDNLSVIIDGNLVLHTGVNIVSGKADAEGTYEGKKITARVFKSGELFQEKLIVQIFVDADKAAEFEF